MLDTLYIGTSGLLSNSLGLQVVGNNLANVNTPGFKGSELEFSDLFEQGNNGGQQQGGQASLGTGVESVGSRLNFQAGSDETTGNPLDLNINGNGMFTVKRGDQILYTRSGAFQFNEQNILVNADGDHVQGLDSNGNLHDVTLDTLDRSVAKQTSTVKIAGNLTTTVATPPVNATLNGVTVIDPAGGSHTVNLSFTNLGTGSYTVTVTDGATGGAVLGTATLSFSGGFPTSATDVLSFNYASTGVNAFPVKLDFSQNVTALTTATTLSMASQDGYQAGVLTDESIGSDGTLNLTYSNGQSAKGPRLALANFGTTEDLSQISDGAFQAAPNSVATYGYAGADSFGSLEAGHLEGSNVDLATEFSNLIVMQRGYQASSHVISTANDMIQELFDMKGHS